MTATQAVHLTAHWDFFYVHLTLGPSYNYPRTGFQVRGERPKWVRSLLMINHYHPMNVFLHIQHVCAPSKCCKKWKVAAGLGVSTLSKTIKINEKLCQEKKKPKSLITIFLTILCTEFYYTSNCFGQACQLTEHWFESEHHNQLLKQQMSNLYSWQAIQAYYSH